jgi:NhaP-type Na+/H+ or K+/H+ antiporter
MGIWAALLVGAALAPDDAAPGAGMMVNPAVPARIRRLINVESGLNDGIATPVALVAIAGAATAEHASGAGPGTATVFVGWFGPRGLASVVFGLLALEALGAPAATPIITVITFTVLLSVLAHGLTAEPAASRYGPRLGPPAGTAGAAGTGARTQADPLLAHTRRPCRCGKLRAQPRRGTNTGQGAAVPAAGWLCAIHVTASA